MNVPSLVGKGRHGRKAALFSLILIVAQFIPVPLTSAAGDEGIKAFVAPRDIRNAIKAEIEELGKGRRVLERLNVPTKIENILDRASARNLQIVRQKELSVDGFPILNVEKPQKFTGSKFRLIEPPRKDTQNFKIEKIEPLEPVLENVITPPESFLKRLKHFVIPPAKAQAAPALVPLKTYRPEMKEDKLDYALYFVSKQQNEDGSYGKRDQFLTTVELFESLKRWNRSDVTNRSVPESMERYFVSYVPETLLERAAKLRALSAIARGWGQNPADTYPEFLPLAESIRAAQNDDGGFNSDSEGPSDVFTSAEVFRTLSVINYQDDAVISRLLAYLIFKIAPDGSVRYDARGEPNYHLMHVFLRALTPLNGAILNVDGAQIPVAEKTAAMAQFIIASFYPEKEVFRYGRDTIDFATNSYWARQYQPGHGLVPTFTDLLKRKQRANGSFANDIRATLEAMHSLARADVRAIEVTHVNPPARSTVSTRFQITIRNWGYEEARDTQLHMFADGALFKPLGDSSLEAYNIRLLPNSSFVLDLTLDYFTTRAFAGPTRFQWYIEPSEDLDFNTNWAELNVNYAPAEDGTPAMPFLWTARSEIARDAEGNPTSGLFFHWQEKPDRNRANYMVAWRPEWVEGWGKLPWSGTFVDPGLTGVHIKSPFSLAGRYEVTMGVLWQDGRTVTFSSNPVIVIPGSEEAEIIGNVTAFVTDSRARVPSGNVVINEFGHFPTNENGAVQINRLPNGTSPLYVHMPQYERTETTVHSRAGLTTGPYRLITRLKPDSVSPQITGLSILKENRSGPQNDFVVNNRGTVAIDILASDDVAAKEADLYYWQPSESRWVFLATTPLAGVPELAEGGFEWDIGEELEGEGFKIKAIVRDYRDNESDAVEWGPFTLRNGTPPSFTVSSPAAGYGATTGERITARWSAASIGAVDAVDVYLAFGDRYESIAQAIPNTGVFEWVIPAQSDFIGQQAKIRVEGRDSFNGRLGVGESAEFVIRDSTTAVPPPWGQPGAVALVDDALTSFGEYQESVTRFDSEGNLHVLYYFLDHAITGYHRDGNNFVYHSKVVDRLVYRVRRGNEWGPVTIPHENTFETEDLLRDYNPPVDIRLELNAAGVPHAMWSIYPVESCGERNSSEVYLTKFVNGAWEPVNRVSRLADRGASILADLGFDSEGRAVVTWVEGWIHSIGDNQCAYAGNSRIMVRRPTADTWTVVDEFGANIPQLAGTQDGRLHLTYSVLTAEQMTTFHRAFDGARWSWSEPVQIANGDASNSSLVASGNALLYAQQQAVVESGVMRTRVIAASFVNNAWSPAAEVSRSAALQWADRPYAFIDARGGKHVLYEFVPETGMRDVFSTSLVNGSWTAPRAVNRASQQPQQKSLFSSAGSQPNFARAGWVGSAALSPTLFVNEVSLDGLVPAPLPTRSVLRNGDMEGFDTSEWRPWGSPVMRKTAATAASPRQSMYINGVGANAGIQQLNIPVRAGEPYLYSFKYKLNAPAAGHSPRIETNMGPKSNFDFESRGASLIRTDNEWHTYRRVFRVPANFVGTWRVVIRMRDAQGYVDDVALEPVGDRQLISDSDMEAVGMAAWRGWGSGAVFGKSAVSTYGGTQSMRVAAIGTHSGFQQLNVPVAAGRRYALTFNYRLLANGAAVPRVESNIGISSSNTDFENKPLVLKRLGDGWYGAYREFTVPADFIRDLRLVVRVRNGEGFVDDVSVVEIRE